MKQWFIYQNNIVHGPYDTKIMLSMFNKGKLVPDSLIKDGEDGEWKVLKSFPLFSGKTDTGDEDKSTMLKPNPPADQMQMARFIRFEGNASVKIACPGCNQHYLVDKNVSPKQKFRCLKCNTSFYFSMSGQKSVTVTLPIPEESKKMSQPVADEIPDGDIICPHCWKSFSQENLLYIAKHPALVGDPVAGEFAQKRFLPISFNSQGQALDAKGTVCTDMACPRCHLKIPSVIIDMKSLYISIVGAPSSGKSYYLTTLAHLLSKRSGEILNCSFMDADPEMNSVLNHYETLLFMTGKTSELAILPKTHQIGVDFSDEVLLDNIHVELPKPFIFELKSMNDVREKNCNVIFYDNAGEHFQPGGDNISNPATQHLACSDGIIFLFDPINDPGMRKFCNEEDPQTLQETKLSDQTLLFVEMVNRIRSQRNMEASEKCPIPLVIVIAKYDAWKNVCNGKPEDFPYLSDNPDTMETELDLNNIYNVSFQMREIMEQYAPGLVNAAEGFFEHICYVPVSNFGCAAEKNESGYIGVVPNKIKPVWVEVPFLILSEQLGLLQAAGNKKAGGAVEILQTKTVGNFFIFQHPATGKKVRLPVSYAGTVLKIDGKLYQVPEILKKKMNSQNFWG